MTRHGTKTENRNRSTNVALHSKLSKSHYSLESSLGMLAQILPHMQATKARSEPRNPSPRENLELISWRNTKWSCLFWRLIIPEYKLLARLTTYNVVVSICSKNNYTSTKLTRILEQEQASREIDRNFT